MKVYSEYMVCKQCQNDMFVAVPNRIDSNVKGGAHTSTHFVD